MRLALALLVALHLCTSYGAQPTPQSVLSESNARSEYAANRAQLEQLQAAAAAGAANATKPSEEASEEASQEQQPQAAEAAAEEQQEASEQQQAPEETKEMWLKHLDVQEQELLFHHNADVLRRLAPAANLKLRRLLEALASPRHYGFVRFNNPVPGGHGVYFEMASGDESALKQAAGEVGGIEIDGHYMLVTPDLTSNAVTAVGRPVSAEQATGHNDGIFKSREAHPEARKEGSLPLVVHKTLSDYDQRSIKATNEHALVKLAPAACGPLRKLLAELYAQGTYIELYNPIKNGHIVDYVLKSGSRSLVQESAKVLHVVADDVQLETEAAEGSKVQATEDPNAPTTDGVVTATADEVHGFEAQAVIKDGGKPIN